MILKISSQFAKDFKSLKDVSLQEKVKHILSLLKMAKNINDAPHFRIIKGSDKAYKIGIGFYYMTGTIISKQEIILMRLVHRDEALQIITST